MGLGFFRNLVSSSKEKVTSLSSEGLGSVLDNIFREAPKSDSSYLPKIAREFHIGESLPSP